MLASIQFRGEQPRTKERWRYIYTAITTSRAIDTTETPSTRIPGEGPHSRGIHLGRSTKMVVLPMRTASADESAELTISLPPWAERCLPTLAAAGRADFARLYAAARRWRPCGTISIT